MASTGSPSADGSPVLEVPPAVEMDLPAEAEVPSSADGISQAAADAAGRAGSAAMRAGAVLTDVASNVGSTVSAKAPAVIEVSRSTVGIAAREVRGASSEDLKLGIGSSAGLALGLLLARAPRGLVLLALVPVMVLSASLASRRNSRGPWAKQRSEPPTTSKAAK